MIRALAAMFAAAGVLLLSGCAAPSAALPRDAADAALLREHPQRLVVVAVANPRERVVPQAGSTLATYNASQRYDAGSEARATLEAIEREHGLREIAAWPISALRVHCVVLEIAPGAEREQVLARLARDPRVELAQPLQDFDTLAAPSAATTAPAAAAVPYNDPYVDLQRGFVEVDAVDAHQRARGEGVRIALIDTGVDTTHPDLHGRIVATRDFVDGRAAQFDADRHGTEVAGVIAAVANNRQGIVGVAPQATLSVYKACWQRPATEGGGARCNSFTLAQALGASIDDGARIINLSLGGPDDPLLARLVGTALGRGRIVIGAMPPDGRPHGFPTGIAGVIAVDTADGAANAAPDKVLRAPGRDILTLEPGGRYDYASGSSLAAAHASAVAALLLEAVPAQGAAAVRTALERSRSGASINACEALATLFAPTRTHRQEQDGSGPCASRGRPTGPPIESGDERPRGAMQ
ncbi:S8 family serine peptidase [Rhizobacter sp. Root16D2]|uniref:S8 family peptidase n=1 Tax=Rhizobacter sp. Root16D2 TaxID=1736479 RepID=UPI0009EC958C|nr:S8 family serine peptidase [Rhizobacter sp. Root16D2]